MNPIASLRPSSLRVLAYYLQHSQRRVPTRYFSILPERQPIPIRSPLLPNLHRSEVIRLNSSPDDPPGSSAGSSPPPSSSSSGGDASDGSDPPPSSPPDHPTPPPSTSISRQSVPENYPQVLALPIARRPLFPGFYKAVVIRNPQVVAAIKEMMKRGQPYLGAFLLKDEQADSDVITDVNSVHPVGVFAQITSVFAAAGAPGREDEKEEGLTAVLYPHRRIRITDLVKAGAFHPPTTQVHSAKEELPTPPPSPEPAEAELSVEHAKRHPAPLQTSFLQDYDISIVNINNLFTQPYNKDDQYILASNVFDEPDKLADFAAAVSTGEVGELQDVLEALVVEDRLRKALLVLKKELINAQLQSKLSRDVDSKIAKPQGIKKELGMESDGKDKLIEKLKARAAQLAMPELVKRVFDEELAKLAHLEPAASEANVTRNYLDWLTQIPWGQHSPENYSISHAKQVLDEDHYGLKDVKDRILEFLAVGKLRGSVEGKIICLVGPPGVGKTSIGKSIARALGRQFFRFSVGGLTDVAEIKGHRRTYVGYGSYLVFNPERPLTQRSSALPGKIIQALKRVGTENPLVLIDEVDKVGRGINGDPASALLEMLDPEQNNAFLDITNVLDTIPAPLLDRMEVIEVSGYVSEEKSVIAERYLGPQAKEASGLKDADVILDPASVDVLIKFYCRESGVRNLKKHIDKIYRKASLKIVEDLGEDALSEKTDAQPTSTSTGATTDEAVPTQDPPPSNTSAETTATPLIDAETSGAEKKVTTEKPKPFKVPDSVHIRISPENLKDYVGPPIYHKDRMYVRPPPAGVSTGLGYLGNGSGAVMPIEATIMPGKGGLQLTGNSAKRVDDDLNDRDVHVHMPEGSVGKEGPSAGTALLSALVSLLTETPIDPEIAMTGEISLVGQTILAPAANQADIEENVPESVKTGIRFVYVEDVKEVLAEVFRGTPLADRLRDTLSS
ncbi:hypothetical protein BGW80DRAFT_1252964 [Lactifluus volemus]|nr:hypothetical protein BGW80DRAFT_1252964 [Lactifluus volemus]